MLKLVLWLALVAWGLHLPSHASAEEIPHDFPQFIVPGQEEEVARLRELFHLHYVPARPLATLWDAWIPMASLWPATTANLGEQHNRAQWRTALLNRHISPEGYVSTHQHRGLAHNDGWPFPLWTQARGIGWHFSLAGEPYREREGVHRSTTLDGWQLDGVTDHGFDRQRGWSFDLTNAHASITTPRFEVDAFVAPFIRLHFRGGTTEPLDEPYLEWTTRDEPEFTPERRMYWSLPQGNQEQRFVHIPCYRHPRWKGKITRLRINFGNRSASQTWTLQSLITAIDSRHNVNNALYLQGCTDYLAWSGDLTFLRENIQRMRLALHYALDEFGIRQQKCVTMSWVGHEGRSGLKLSPDGKKILHGEGVGTNYWDLLPFGGQDALATIYYYDVLQRMAALERQIAAHPAWNIPGGPLKFAADDLTQLAAEVKQTAGELFWNRETGRFVAAIDHDGQPHDYGYTFVNCEAIYFDFASREQAESIVAWLAGERLVEGDTSQGEDIYHWRFGPRATTRRNIEYYAFPWSAPEVIPWGGQVQDGGAVLGFGYHDLMARLKIRGADNAWRRLQTTIAWFEEVQNAGGYRAYYAQPGRGTLQGGGTAGGLGLDHEFFESILVPQVMLYGFLGFRPSLDSFAVEPRLPAAWPALIVTRIHFHDLQLDITATNDTLEITGQGHVRPGLTLTVPAGWKLEASDSTPAESIPLPDTPQWKLRLVRP